MKEKVYIKVSSIDELKQNIGNFVEFTCTRCNRISTRKIRKDRPHTYNDLLCCRCHRELTCIKHFGVPHNFQVAGFVERSVAKKIERYGDACNLAKRYNTCQSRYGVNNYCQTREFKEQSHNTTIQKFGSIQQSYKEREKKSRKTKKAKYGLETYHNVESFKQTVAKHRAEFEAKHDCISLNALIQKYGQGFKSLRLEKIYDKSGNAYISTHLLKQIQDYASQNHNMIATSKAEKDVYDFVCSIYTGNVIRNTFSYLKNNEGKAFEIDIYIPELKLGIEYNGIYWHSTKYIKDKYYHANKTLMARKAKINLIHIFEDQWSSNIQLCKKRIAECIAGSYNNILAIHDDILVGDNSFPIFGNYEIVKITKPSKHQLERFAYYDCGKIFYRRK